MAGVQNHVFLAVELPSVFNGFSEETAQMVFTDTTQEDNRSTVLLKADQAFDKGQSGKETACPAPNDQLPSTNKRVDQKFASTDADAQEATEPSTTGHEKKIARLAGKIRPRGPKNTTTTGGSKPGTNGKPKPTKPSS